MKKLTAVTFSSLLIEPFTEVHKPAGAALKTRPKRLHSIPFNPRLICRSRGYP
ncbi:hypothetical protein [Pedobacter zeae]|uniref:Uncharacterized protein n=1 Tax=Pedobacter zeae TaxID=1737356 RepID=A0A7W6P596_9SPHI|nr:hypothetical protein [Pedobacter zeae]MBB4106674.1 hypothetical protein [Pedobacter zeae]